MRADHFAMLAKTVLFVGGLLGAAAFIAAADMYVLREEVATVDFAQDVIDEVLDDPETRAPLVEELTDSWIEKNGGDRLDANPNARTEIREAIDEFVAGERFRAQVSAELDDLARREDALGTETISIDLAPALEDVFADLPPRAAAALDSETVVDMQADLARLSTARAGLRAGTGLALGVGVFLLVLMLFVSRSVRRPARAVMLFGLPMSLVQPAIVDSALANADVGDDRYAQVVRDSIASRLESPLGAIVAVFAMLAVAEVIAFGVGRLRASPVPAEPPTMERPGQPEPVVAPKDIDWIVRERYEDRLAS